MSDGKRDQPQNSALFPPVPSRRRWCGLKARTALLLAGVVALVVIGAIVGGVVGSLSTKSRSSSSADTPADTSNATATTPSSTPPTSSTPTTTSSASPKQTTGVLELNCPAINNSQYTTQGETFGIYCLTDFTATGGNIAQSFQDSINGCIESCATYNSNETNADSLCQGLTFGANLTRYAGGNCFLKTGTLTKKAYAVDGSQAGAVWIH